MRRRTAITKADFRIDHCSFRRHAEILEGEDQLSKEAEMKQELSEFELSGKKKKPHHRPIVSRKSFAEEVAQANRYSKQDKVTTRNNLCPPEKQQTKQPPSGKPPTPPGGAERI